MPTQKAKPSARRAKNWVIAIDPFAGADLREIVDLSHRLTKTAGNQLNAAYILAPASLNWTGEFSGPWRKKYEPVAQARLTELLPDTAITKSIVHCKNPGIRAAVQALLAHAKKLKANGIVLSTHARTGLERLAMGSFAETVILTSPIPVLVLNPSHNLPKTVRKILVPTDLSKKNEKFTLSIADYAQGIGADILLYHKEIDPLDPMIQQGVYSLGGGWVSMQEFMDEDREAKEKQLLKLESQIRTRKVKVSHVIDSSPGGLVDTIEKAAKDHQADMIAVLTQAGTWSAALLGSVARSLVRTASVPVLVQR
jgi:nucleotide-binding universal stress UspA family protein